MHFLCSTFGSAGDVFPMLGLAVELRGRGHQVTFATNDHFRRVATALDLPFEPLGTQADFDACVNNPDLWHPRKAFRHVFESMRPVLRRQYELHAERCGAGDLVGLTNCFGLGALLARETLRIPVLTVHLQPAVLWSDYQPPTFPGFFGPRWLRSILYRIAERMVIDPVVCPFLNAWRAEYGLPPVRRIMRWWNSPDGVVCLFPEWYAPRQPDWPTPLEQTDFPLWNFQSDEPLAADVEQFLRAGTPPLVFTPGSANSHGREFFAAAAGACARLNRRGIFLSQFAEHIPTNLPSTLVHFRYVPLDLLLPRCAAFVHHGGVGSTSQAMLAGIPQVLTPLAHDQFDNAERVKRLRIGDSIPAPRLTDSRLVAALRPLLDNPQVASVCRQVADRLRSEAGLARAADWIERCVATPQAKSARGRNE